MTIAELFERAGIDVTSGITEQKPVDTAVKGVACDSRKLAAGQVFVAIRGERSDGADFAHQAKSRGAVAVVAECPSPPGFGMPWAEVADARETLARLAAGFHGEPSNELIVVGTTGTNGKTTTTYLIEGVFEQAGMSCGRISSVSYRVAGTEQTATRTTPESSDLQALLRQMVDRDCQACVMEVSSHALSLRRVDEISFDAVVFTNLTRDHLDFHGDMSGYFDAKRRLFQMTNGTAPAVINVDDPYGRTLATEVKRPVTYGIDTTADVMPTQMDLSACGIELDLRTSRGPLHIRSSLLGRGNTYNILAAAAAGAAMDLPFSAIEHGILSVTRVPGRMQLVSGRDDVVAVVVDFAHTDDALRSLLETARGITHGRLITVFGCGGERDATKRPLMGAVAGRLSDLVIVTSDNPRSEDPSQIIRDIELGRDDSTQWLTMPDRTEAINQAIQKARPGDVVVIAGKGHEQHQVIGTQKVPFDDSTVAREALALRRSGSRVG